MELTYRQEGDYLLPNVIPPEEPKVGKYGMLRREYLRKHRHPIFTGMLLGGKLNSHLEEVDARANEMLESLTTQMAKSEGVTESLKAKNQMLWVQMMNNIRSRAEEIVLTELVYS
ncbi:MAG: TnpV protein [Ruminococcus sp.]|nr:TnpV protein [Ruminococcus sp.]